jgi:L-threonylcarbamoyladenylate synthase
MEVTTVERAAAALERGGVVVFPTETVYGLGCRIDRPQAISRIFALKARPQDKSLQVLLPDPSEIGRIARMIDGAEEVVRRFMPGPLTLVLEAREGLPDLGDQPGTVGVRVPDHPVALALLSACGPMSATSANRSGEPTPSTLDGVREIFGDDVDAYVGGGAAPTGLSSTVLSLAGPSPMILREGAVSAESLADALGRRVGVRGR